MNLLRMLLLGLILTTPSFAQQESGASLSIRFLSDTNRFHVGEIIPVELSFKTLIPDAYEFSNRNYDRSGRLNIERFHVTPLGRDPLEAYYSNGAFIGGGLSSSATLSAEPQVVREELNEWVALDQPGHYSLSITSGRVARLASPRNEPVELQSNSIEFDVVAADPAWQQQTFSTSVAALNSEASTPEEKRTAIRVLRFLDTPASVHELVRLMGSASPNGDWDFIGGLAGSRHQDLVVRELTNQLRAPDIAITADYLYILAKLRFLHEHAPPPPYPKDPQQRPAWEERQKTRNDELSALQDSLYEETAALVSSKLGAARAATVQTLLERSNQRPGIVSTTELPGAEVAAAFQNLPPDQQWNMLLNFWERLKVPVMLEPLKKVVQQPDMTHQMLRDVALRRLYDLNPAEATPVFLEEMRHPHIDGGYSTVKGGTLGLLPNESLPEFDEMFATRLEQKETRTRDLDAQLLGRYATKAILPRVKSAYEAFLHGSSCVASDGLFLYFLRVDPDYGVKHMSDEGVDLCMEHAPAAVAKMNRFSEVEPGLIAWLNGPDLNRARSAAETLATYGGSDTQKVLWDRLKRFHAQWLARQDELTYRANMKRDANEASGFQFGLVEAIGKAQAWLLTNEQLTDLENLTLGQERDNVKQWHWSSPVNLQVNFFGDQMQASIGQYSVQSIEATRSKLSQYPKGTKFSLSIFGSPNQMNSTLDAINDMAGQYGLQIDRPPAN
jgi:hypothetical protein